MKPRAHGLLPGKWIAAVRGRLFSRMTPEKSRIAQLRSNIDALNTEMKTAARLAEQKQAELAAQIRTAIIDYGCYFVVPHQVGHSVRCKLLYADDIVSDSIPLHIRDAVLHPILQLVHAIPTSSDVIWIAKQ
jgi:hypothetical protein